MPDKLTIQSRKPLRLRGFCYKHAGYYFVTACTYNRVCLFGKIIDDKMSLNSAGQMILIALNNIVGNIYSQWQLDTYVIMPNHMHIIFSVTHANATLSSSHSLPQVMQHIKSYTTVEYTRGVINNNWPTFNKHLWQRSYHERIIRRDDDLDKIRQYVKDNPLKWATDINNHDGM